MAGWNPLTSAASGAAFAGLLAALVIAVSIQIAFQAGNARRDQAMSLKAAAPTLVTLMVASYLYIVLDGIPSTSSEVVDALGPSVAAALQDPNAAGEAFAEVGVAADNYAELAARGFAASGTVLALGALMTLFIVVASIFDNTAVDGSAPDRTSGERQAREWALAVLRVAVVTVVIILLLGYQVGASTVEIRTDGRWWVAHATALSAGPVAAAAWLMARRRRTMQLPAVIHPAVISMIVFVLAALPALVVLGIVTAGTAHARAVGLNVVTMSSAVYFSAFAGVLLLLLESRDTLHPQPGGTASSTATPPASHAASSEPPAVGDKPVAELNERKAVASASDHLTSQPADRERSNPAGEVTPVAGLRT